MTNAEFSKLVGQYQALVYTVCYQLGQDHQTAQDLAQETFLAAYTHMDACPPEHYKPWLARIAANKAKDHLKSAWCRKVGLPGEDAMPETPRPGAPPGPQSPEQAAVDRDEAAAIADLVRGLRQPYGPVARMYFLEERTVDEIASALGRPVKTVHTQLYRARQMLQRQIQERGNS